MVGIDGSTQQKRRGTRTTDCAGDKAVLAGLYADLDQLTATLDAVSAETGLRFAQQAQRTFHAIELEKLAALAKAGASENDTRRRAAAGGTRSRKAASKTKKRAATVRRNPNLANDVRAGELGEEHLDALANASEKSGGDAATDNTLIDQLKDTTPDDAGKVTQQWLERRDNSTETRYQRQRRQRSLSFGHDKVTGCRTLTARGDNESVDELKKKLEARANEMYREDGGRDLPKDQHPRTHHQRMFDALCELLGTSSEVGGAPDDDIAPGGNVPNRKSQRPNAPHPKSMTHVFFTVDEDDEATIRAASLNGDGYLPQEVLDRYSCASTIAGTVFNTKGEVIWFGLQKRYATPAQFAALIARDQGCVICRADASRCEAHHITPWNAPARGRTDIENLVLVCTSCHHWLHDEHQTLYWTLAPPGNAPPGNAPPGNTPPRNDRAGRNPSGEKPSRKWATRSALPNEIAPKRQPKAA